MIPIQWIRADLLRRTEDHLEELICSIEANGLLEPITVRHEEEGYYRVVSGKRRLQACAEVGMSTVPCILIGGDPVECEIYSLALQQTQQPIHYLEEAELLQRVMCGSSLNLRELAERTGKSPAYLAAKLKLTELSKEQTRLLRDNELSEEFAKQLLKLPEEERDAFLQETIGGYRQTGTERNKALARQKDRPTEQKKIMIFKDLTVFTNTVERAIDTMRQSGINAASEKEETETNITYTVTIQKTG